MSPIETAYLRYQPMLRAKCVRMLGEADADDVVQEAFLRFVRSRAQGRAPDVAVAWLYRVATRIAIDHLRRRAHRRRAIDAIEPPRSIDRSGAAEARHLIRLLVGRVPRRTLEAAVLHRVDGLSHAEVAEVCRCSPRTVRRLIARFDASAAKVSR